MTLLDALNRRYAVKRFSDNIIDPDRINTLLEATRLSPSAFGIQPYRLILVQNPAVRAQLVSHSMGQGKVLHSSHLLIFAACMEVDVSMVDQLIDHLAARRGGGIEAYTGLSQHVKSYLHDMNAEEQAAWVEQQLFIAFGTCLTSAALLDIDCCPMTGIDQAGYDRVLGLPQEGLRTVAVCALGQRHPDDDAASQIKVRLPMAEMVQRLP